LASFKVPDPEKEETDKWVQEQKDQNLETLGDLIEENRELEKLFKGDWPSLKLSEMDSAALQQLKNYLKICGARKEKFEAAEKVKKEAEEKEKVAAEALKLKAAQEAEKKRLEEEKKGLLESTDKAFQWDVGSCTGIVVSNEGKTLLRESGSGITFRANQGWTTGRHVWNILIENDASAGYIRCGFVTNDYPYSGPSNTLLGDHKAAPGFWSGSPLYDASGFPKATGHPSNCPRYGPGSVLTFCLDLDAKEFFIDDLSGKATNTVSFKKWYNNLPVGNGITYFPAVSLYPNCKVTLKATANS